MFIISKCDYRTAENSRASFPLRQSWRVETGPASRSSGGKEKINLIKLIVTLATAAGDPCRDAPAQ